MGHIPIRSKAGLAAVAKVRKICDKLPEFEEQQDDLGHTSFRIRDKPFVLLGEDSTGCWLNIKVEHATQSRLVREGRFQRSPYIGRHGWATRPAEGADWKEVAGLIAEAYRRVAPKSVLKALAPQPGTN